MQKEKKYPLKKLGNIEIYPEIIDGRWINITIIGDPEGFRYLIKILEYVSEYDQECDDQSPPGSRYHIHLHAGEQLGNHSCEVEICRADAKSTCQLPEFMHDL